MASSRESLPKTPASPLSDVLLGDCKDVLASLPDAFVDLVYLDPPFLTQKKHKLANRERSRTFSFADLWKSHDEYAEFLYDRVIPCRNVLKSTGSLFFHCDRNAIHIARAVLDEVFGSDCFRSEIIWSYRRWSNSKNGLLASHQSILYYSKTDDYVFNSLFTDYSPSTNVDQILQQRARDGFGKSVYRRDVSGAVLSSGGKRGVPLGDVWDIPYLNPKANERVGYPTQKPILLLERIIQISSNPNDIVVDPFCGSGTTLVASKLLDRQFIGIDISSDACELAKSRLASPVKSESALMESGRDTYNTADTELLQLLAGCDYVPVQRNNGIDAIVNTADLKSVALVRIQRPHETIAEAASCLVKASRGKNAALLVVVKTKDVATLFGDEESPSDVFVVDATGHAISTALRQMQQDGHVTMR